LHSIAQNYPLKPTVDQKKEYLLFFKLTGSVLPCRYCRESYQQFIIQPDTRLNDAVMDSRKTLSMWLYKIHNKVNNKLNVMSPNFKEVWNKYESFRSKCTKTIIKKKGCTDPLKGSRKRCFMNIKNVNENGSPLPLSFGKKRTKLKLINIKKSNNPGKKFMATFEKNGRTKVIHFGAKGMSDFTKHHDSDRRSRYISRHRKDLKTNDPSRAGYLSMYILWNKSNFQASVRDYRRRLGIYNRTGKFLV